jgi:pantoate--beta-alanine ligase
LKIDFFEVCYCAEDNASYCKKTMKIIETITDMQSFSCELRREGKTIGLVPTMGYLHEGHLSLVDEAKKHADVVIVSIFVNPTQFAPNEDLDAYPHDLERDCQLCEFRKVDAIFAPAVDEIYCPDSSTWVNEEKLSQGLCGKTRPTHFRGVTTIVAKLFNATLPDVAVFGRKDYQQAIIIKRMVRDLNFPIKIITAPIVREKDGLAMSSRNKYLSPEERKNALSISQSLQAAVQAVLKGGSTAMKNSEFKVQSSELREEYLRNSQNSLTELNVFSVKKMINLRISQAGGKIDYIEIVDADTLEQKDEFTGKFFIAVAAFFGKTRLIDNVVVDA